MKTDAEKYLIITSALPYANGPIHIGHLVEYIQTDIYSRYKKMSSDRTTLYFCADDTHGAPIMIRANQEKITPEELIARYQKEHLEDFAAFNIVFDNYHSTNSDENRQIAEEIFSKLKSTGSIVEREVERSYCEHDGMFLPDRYVRGACPRCSAADQYGDLCEKCGAHYDPTDLIEPRCSICSSAPTLKSSVHYFFRVADYEARLREFIDSGAIGATLANYLRGWIEEGLRDWDISRDGPYFGFLIPGERDKYFYVWLDAPIGYISASKNWADKNGVDIDRLWRSSDTRIEHFIGKDIIYFHTLFWIPLLTGSGYSTPSKIWTHGFLTVNGEKMSKSKGTFITARDYLKHLDPEYLRYYYASKLKNGIDDIDLNLDDFMTRVNADMVNKIANLGSRVISIFNRTKTLNNRVGKMDLVGQALIEKILSAKPSIERLYDEIDFAAVTRQIARLADEANRYIDQAAPWELGDDIERLREVLSAGVNAFRLIMIYLAPIAPAMASKSERILKVDKFRWSDLSTILENHSIGAFERLADRIGAKRIDALTRDLSASPSDAREKKARGEDSPADSEPIGIEDFSKIELRVAKIIEAEPIPKSDRLLKLTLDLGSERRVVVAGIGSARAPADLIDKRIVALTNLKPRSICGVMSHGMALAASEPGSGRLGLVTIDDPSFEPGARVS